MTLLIYNDIFLKHNTRYEQAEMVTGKECDVGCADAWYADTEELERQYEQPESREVYAQRKIRVEHPFGHIKRNLWND